MGYIIALLLILTSMSVLWAVLTELSYRAWYKTALDLADELGLCMAGYDKEAEDGLPDTV